MRTTSGKLHREVQYEQLIHRMKVMDRKKEIALVKIDNEVPETPQEIPSFPIRKVPKEKAIYYLRMFLP